MAVKPRFLTQIISRSHSENPATLMPLTQSALPERSQSILLLIAYNLLPEHSGENNHHCLKHITVPLLQLEQPAKDMYSWWVNVLIWLMTEKRNCQAVEILMEILEDHRKSSKEKSSVAETTFQDVLMKLTSWLSLGCRKTSLTKVTSSSNNWYFLGLDDFQKMCRTIPF